MNYRDFVKHLTPWRVENSDKKLEDGGYMSSVDHRVEDIDEAHVISSMRRERVEPPAGASMLDDGVRHDVVLDIDLPALLVPSTTPGNSHLIVRLPGDGARSLDYDAFLFAAAKIGLVEEGYADVSAKRGRSDVRLPWIRKGGDGEEPFVDTRSDA